MTIVKMGFVPYFIQTLILNGSQICENVEYRNTIFSKNSISGMPKPV